MDLLRVANDINAELIHIQLRYSDVFDQQEPAAIFNSVVTCITDDLADTLKLQVIDRRDPQQVFVSWEYDLHDRQYPRRVGPKLEAILQQLKELPRNAARLICKPQWSRHFLSLDAISQERLLRYTIWGKNQSELQRTPTLPDTQGERSHKVTSPGSAFSVRSVDLSLLELELLKLASETSILDKRDVSVTCESVKKCIDAYHIQGVHLELIENDKDLLLEWNYILSLELKLIREGTSPEQVLNIAKAVKGHPKLLVSPIQTPSFRQLSPKIQQEVMKDTIWASAFKRKGLLGL